MEILVIEFPPHEWVGKIHVGEGLFRKCYFIIYYFTMNVILLISIIYFILNENCLLHNCLIKIKINNTF